MFETLKPLPADPILGLSAAYREDPSGDKIDLGVGVYKDESGATPIMAAVKKAELLRLEETYGLEVDPDALVSDLPVGLGNGNLQVVTVAAQAYANEVFQLVEPTFIIII